MDFLLVGTTAFVASALTLYSGFGLGTVLLPAFALFFPAETAVAATAVVHLLNNLFKGALLHRSAAWSIVGRFGLPAVPAAVLGAWALARLGDSQTPFTWVAFGHTFEPSGAAMVIGVLMVLLAGLEMQPWFQRLAAPLRLLPLGGALTGFLGGLSGQQGALRSMFLLRVGLEPPAYIATGVMIAILIDLARLPAYAASLGITRAPRELALLADGTLCAFAGAWLAARFARRATLDAIRLIVAALMCGIGLALITGRLGT